MKKFEKSFGLLVEFGGVTLQTYIEKNKKFSTELFLDHAFKIIEKIDMMHSVNILHRDIKSANILIKNEKSTYVIDFGFSVFVSDKNPFYTTKIIQGTPNYMSPEQYAKVKRMDKRTDVYSLGVTFYEMLTGRLPFFLKITENVDPYSIMNDIVTKKPPPMLESDGVPKALERIIMKMLEKNPDNRYDSMKSLLKELQQFKNNSGF